jgi:hypothetical protein
MSIFGTKFTLNRAICSKTKNFRHALKKVLGKEAEEENVGSMSVNQVDLMAKIQQMRQNISPSDMMNLMNKFLSK